MKKAFAKSAAIAAMAAALAACTSNEGMGGFAGKADTKNIGVALKAQNALIKGENDVAVAYAEQAVANKPQDAGFRALLGNAYFASGRFASAEAAYRDSLQLYPAQPQVILKKALVEIGQGKNAQALNGLEAARGYVDAADLGLAVALAGRPNVAVEMLETAARSPQADARTRQNLALVYAMVGDWAKARVVASQDLPADQVEGRMASWTRMASPEHPSHAIAALTGVVPAQVDPGQPVALALNQDAAQPRYAALAPEAAAPAPVAAPTPVAEAAVVEMPEPVRMAEVAPRQRIALGDAPTAFAKTIDIPVRDVTLVDATAEAAEAEAVVADAGLDVDPIAPVALVAKAAAVAKAAEAPAPGLSADTVRLTESVKSIRHKAVAAEKASRSVVQLGAYSKRASLSRGWDAATSRVEGLAAYQPMAARYTVNGKKVYRLAAHGFASDAAARDFCVDVRRSGVECFVRKMAGDAPTVFASKN